MTIERNSKKTKMYGRLMIALAFPVIACAVLLILMYNRNVQIEYDTKETLSNIRSLEVQISDTRAVLFALLDVENLVEFAVARGLLEDKKPHYLEIKSTWGLASHY